MNISFSNILFFCISLILMVFGIFLLAQINYFNFIPEEVKFLNLPSLVMIIGGTGTCISISHPINKIIRACIDSTKLFFHTSSIHGVSESDIQTVIDWKNKLESNKYSALEELSENYSGNYEGYIFSMLDRNYSKEELRKLGCINIEENYIWQLSVNEIILSMGTLSQIFGMIITLVYLISIFFGYTINEILFYDLGTALLATLYGTIIKYFIFFPMSKKMNNEAAFRYYRESLILEGLIMISEKKTSLQIYDRLKAHIRVNKNII